VTEAAKMLLTAAFAEIDRITTEVAKLRIVVDRQSETIVRLKAEIDARESAMSVRGGRFA